MSELNKLKAKSPHTCWWTNGVYYRRHNETGNVDVWTGKAWKQFGVGGPKAA